MAQVKVDTISNKYELVNVMVRKMDGAYLAGHISKAENIHTW